MTPEQTVVDALMDMTVPAMERIGYDPSIGCIAAVRVALAVCRRYGLDAKPLVARATIFNPKAREMIDAGLEPSEAVWTDGGWSVGVGWPEPGEPLGKVNGRKWGGHLVITLEGRYLLDLMIGTAASRPDHDMPLPPALGMPLEGAERGWVLPSGVLVLYHLYPGERSYTVAKDWRLTSRQAPAVGEIIRAIDQRLRETP